MPGYISEFKYYGQSTEEFVEIALPTGTDPSGYIVAFYMANGQQYGSYSLGSAEGTMGGHDVYVIDDSDSGFATSDEMGNFYPDDAIALIDDNGNVVQFVSWEGNTVTATDGPASGATSTNSGNITQIGQSMQSDDGGQTYYAQSNANSGSIPACYAPGTLIETPNGARPIETLKIGDALLGHDGKAHTIRWLWSADQSLDNVKRQEKPVLIAKGALGDGHPQRDMIVSGQHRIAAGLDGQLPEINNGACFVRAKALTSRPGIRFMAGKQAITWHHILCDAHYLISANGALSETLLLGPQILKNLTRPQLREISFALDQNVSSKTAMQTALPCESVRETRDRFSKTRKQVDFGLGAFRHISGALRNNSAFPPSHLLQAIG